MKYLDYKENIIRGSSGFPIGYYHLTPAHPRYNMPPHWHDEYELIHVQEGTLYVNINGKPLTLHKHDTALVNSGFLHSAEPQNGCMYECIVFDLEFFLKQRSSSPEIPSELLENKICIADFFSSEDEDFLKIFSRISDILVSRPPGHTLLTEGAVLSFVGLLIYKNKFTASPQRGILKSKKSDELKTILNYIAMNYSNPVTLEELSAQVHMNPNYFCRFFKEMTGKTPVTYLNYYRVECACEKMCVSNDKIINIALDCGFGDVNYFIKVFKKYKGCTPLQYMHNRI